MSALVLWLIFLFSQTKVYHNTQKAISVYSIQIWPDFMKNNSHQRRMELQKCQLDQHLVGKIEKKLQRFASCSTCQLYHDWDCFSKERNRSLSTYINVNRPKKTYSCIGEAFMAKNISINRRNMKIKYSTHNLTDQDFLCNGWEHYVPYRCL